MRALEQDVGTFTVYLLAERHVVKQFPQKGSTLLVGSPSRMERALPNVEVVRKQIVPAHTTDNQVRLGNSTASTKRPVRNRPDVCLRIMKTPLFATVLLASQALALFSVYEDMFASPKFLVRYDTEDEITHSEAQELASLPDNSTYEFLRASDGSQYICQIPPVEEEDAYTPTLEDGLSSNLNHYSVEITKLLGHAVLFSAQRSYWTYAFDAQKELAQFNGGINEYNDPKVYKFILGRGNERIDFPKLEARKSNGMFYLSHTMDNGSICDVTGKPRTAEIQYICDPSHDNPTLLWVKEYRTCQYQAQISIPFLCENELLNQREEIYNEILCTKIVDAKSRDTARDNKKVFNHRERINIMDYNLKYIEEQLFMGQLKGNASIIIDTSGDGADLNGRFVRAFIKNFPRYFFTDSTLHQQLTNSMNFRYHANIYDKTGMYIRSTFIEASYNEKHQLVLYTDQSIRDFTVENSNVEPLSSSVQPEIPQASEESIQSPGQPTLDDSLKAEVQVDALMGAMEGDDNDIIVMRFKKSTEGQLDLISVDTETVPGEHIDAPVDHNGNVPAHDEL